MGHETKVFIGAAVSAPETGVVSAAHITFSGANPVFSPVCAELSTANAAHSPEWPGLSTASEEFPPACITFSPAAREFSTEWPRFSTAGLAFSPEWRQFSPECAAIDFRNSLVIVDAAGFLLFPVRYAASPPRR